jgi:hypothetical protein
LGVLGVSWSQAFRSLIASYETYCPGSECSTLVWVIVLQAGRADAMSDIGRHGLDKVRHAFPGLFAESPSSRAAATTAHLDLSPIIPISFRGWVIERFAHWCSYSIAFLSYCMHGVCRVTIQTLTRCCQKRIVKRRSEHYANQYFRCVVSCCL